MANQLSRLDIEKDHVYDYLEGAHPATDDYTTAVNNLQTLHSMEPERNRLNANTVFTGLAYIGVSACILVMEAFGHTITSRAASYSVFKPRI